MFGRAQRSSNCWASCPPSVRGFWREQRLLGGLEGKSEAILGRVLAWFFWGYVWAGVFGRFWLGFGMFWLGFWWAFFGFWYVLAGFFMGPFVKGSQALRGHNEGFGMMAEASWVIFLLFLVLVKRPLRVRCFLFQKGKAFLVFFVLFVPKGKAFLVFFVFFVPLRVWHSIGHTVLDVILAEAMKEDSEARRGGTGNAEVKNLQTNTEDH